MAGHLQSYTKLSEPLIQDIRFNRDYFRYYDYQTPPCQKSFGVVEITLKVDQTIFGQPGEEIKIFLAKDIFNGWENSPNYFKYQEEMVWTGTGSEVPLQPGTTLGLGLMRSNVVDHWLLIDEQPFTISSDGWMMISETINSCDSLVRPEVNINFESFIEEVRSCYNSDQKSNLYYSRHSTVDLPQSYASYCQDAPSDGSCASDDHCLGENQICVERACVDADANLDTIVP